ncbi:MAG TPA: ShlB/FhaC/HecB family hemolysin secretion/activation protein [Nitrospira sp.]|nr:ShlB/FhaC/HecB family hemolysin secretion/activation protein [Nitrospira sp.]
MMTGRIKFRKHKDFRFRCPSSYSLIFGVAVLLIGVTADLGFGQIGLPPPIDPSGRSGLPPPVQREQPLEPKESPSDVLPPIQPAPEELQERGPVLRIFVSKIQVVGSTVLSQEELSQLAAPYENRDVTSEDLEDLRSLLTMVYITKGYPNSGAILPDQDLLDGIVTLQVIEGRLSEIRIDGAQWFRPSYLRHRIELGATSPLNSTRLRDRLQLLLQDDRLQELHGSLKPGAELGEAILEVSMVEAKPVKAFVEYNNYINPGVGENQLRGTVIHRNLTGNGDLLSLGFGASAQATPFVVGVFPSVDALYQIPLNRYDTTFSAAYRYVNFQVTSDPFRSLDIKSETQIWTLSLRHPVYRTLNDEMALSIVGEYEQNANTLLGLPFDSVAGMKNGFGNIAALRFIQEWTHRTAESVFAVRSRFSTGIGVLGATVNSGPDSADGQFVSWLGQLQWLKQFASTGIELLNLVNVQLANDRLFPLEQMSVGGRYSVRGYRENTLLRDNGAVYQFEVRLPLWRSSTGLPHLQFCPFADVGHSWSTKTNVGDVHTLASVGAGLRFNFNSLSNLSVYWGRRLVTANVSNPHNSLQDEGIHVQLVLNLW